MNNKLFEEIRCRVRDETVQEIVRKMIKKGFDFALITAVTGVPEEKIIEMHKQSQRLDRSAAAHKRKLKRTIKRNPHLPSTTINFEGQFAKTIKMLG